MNLQYVSYDWGHQLGPIMLPNNWSVMFDMMGGDADPRNWEHTTYDCHIVCRDGELEITEVKPVPQEES